MGIGIDFSNGLGVAPDQGNPAAILTYQGLVPAAPAVGITTTETPSLQPFGTTPSGVIPTTSTATTPGSTSTVGGILSAIGGALNPSSYPVGSSGAPNINTVSATAVAPNPLTSPILWLGLLVIVGAGGYLLLHKKK